MWVEVGGVELHQAHSQGEEGGAVSLRLPAVVQRLQQEHPNLPQGRIFSIISPYTHQTRVSDPDPDPHCSRQWYGSGLDPDSMGVPGSAIRIRIQEGKNDPQ